jgi:hypothetical protein
VRDLTPETHGNAIGIGLADFTTARLVRGMDHKKTYINALTSLSVNGPKIPIYFDTDREAITQALNSLAIPNILDAKVMRIADTLSLTRLQISEAFGKPPSHLEVIDAASDMHFDAAGTLL